MRKKLLAVLGLLVVLALSFTACGGVDKEASVSVPIEDFSEQNNITQQIEVAAGGTLTVNLGSNPTTGFQWSEEAQISDGTVLAQTAHDYSGQSTSSTLGAGGQETWTFQAKKKGTATVSMEYGRPWEGGEKATWTYTLNVTVK